MTASFIAFFAPYWGVALNQKFKVLGFSRTGRSIYINIAGRKKMVPAAVLLVV